MLALLAVAAMANTSPADLLSATAEAPPPIAQLYLDEARPGFVRAPSRCKAAARIQTGFEPALLFREQDRANARARALIDLPPAEACLVGTSPGAPSARK